MIVERYTVNASARAAMRAGAINWPSNLSGTGYAVVNDRGEVVKRFAFAFDAAAYADRLS